MVRLKRLDTNECYKCNTDDVDWAVKIACVVFDCPKQNIKVISFKKKGTVYES